MKANESTRTTRATPAAYEGNATTTTKPSKLMRLPSTMEFTGMGRSSIYAGVRAKTFPAPVRLSARAVGWRLSDLESWISERETAVAK